MTAIQPTSVSMPGGLPDPITLRDATDGISTVTEGYKEMTDTMMLAGNVMADMFSMIGEGLAGNKAAWHEMGTVALNVISQIIHAMLAKAIAGMISDGATKGLPGLILAAIGVGALKAMWGNLVPKMADGGILYGPQMVLAGEYSGARTNPEIIAPLSKLRDMMGGGGSTNLTGQFVLRGTDLLALIDNTNKRKQTVK